MNNMTDMAFRLNYLGNSCLQLTTGDGTTIVSDPYGKERPDGLGDLPVNLTANAVTISHTHPDHNNAQAVGGNPRVLTEPGVYQIGAVKVTACMGWEGSPEGPSKTMRNVVFVFEAGGARVVQLGDSGIVTDPEVLIVISDADLVMVNIDGYVIPHQSVVPFMKRIKARTILLAHYTLSGKKVWCGAPTAEEFIKTFAPDLHVLRTGSEIDINPGMSDQIAVMTPLTLIQ